MQSRLGGRIDIGPPPASGCVRDARSVAGSFAARGDHDGRGAAGARPAAVGRRGLGPALAAAATVVPQ